MLLAYDVVVVDEAHERHLSCDLLLALLKVIVRKRNAPQGAPEVGLRHLKVILMSATLNAQLFADYFGGAPVIEVPGRMYPVRLDYVPGAQDREQARLAKAALQEEAEEAARSGTISEAAAALSRRRVRVAFDPSPYVKLLQRIDSLVPAEERGDLLVFLGGAAQPPTALRHFIHLVLSS